MKPTSKPAVPRVRKLKFPLTPAGARDWFGNQAVSDLFHGLSVFFPLGEKHFIDSVRPFAARITDLALKEEVAAFMKQEAYHSREHVRYNEILALFGYPVERLERRVAKRINLVRKYLSPRRQLAGTCALEHFTAVIADGLLSEPKLLENADARFAALWRWHAIEELEHKAVAFDVFQSAGGTYIERVRSMLMVSIFFTQSIVVHVNAMLRADGIAPLEGWDEIRRYLFSDTKAGWRMLRHYIAYYKPRFHPWENDNTHFITAWNAEFATLVAALGIEQGAEEAARA